MATTEPVSKYLGGIQCSSDNERVGYEIPNEIHPRLGGYHIPAGLVGFSSIHGLSQKKQKGGIPVPIRNDITEDNTILGGTVNDSLYSHFLMGDKPHPE